MLIPLASFLGPFIATAVVVALPQIVAARGFTPAQAGWYTSAYFVTAAVFMMPVARAGDLYGRGPVLGLGVAIIALTALLGAWVVDPVAQIALRLVQGVGSAGVFGTGPALLAQLVAPERRGRAIGLNITVTYIGLTAGPALGGVLTQAFGWRSIFYFTGGVGLAVAVALWRRLPRAAASAPGGRFDFLGALLLGAALGLFWLASGRAQHADALLLLGTAAVLLWWFIGHQRRTPQPLIDLALLAPGQGLRYSAAAALLHYCGVFGLSYVLSLVLQHGVGIGAARAGLLMAVQPVLQTLLAVPAGRLADRVPARRKPWASRRADSPRLRTCRRPCWWCVRASREFPRWRRCCAIFSTHRGPAWRSSHRRRAPRPPPRGPALHPEASRAACRSWPRNQDGG